MTVVSEPQYVAETLAWCNARRAEQGKKALRKKMVDLLGQDISDVMLHGASAITGVPIDVAGRMGISRDTIRELRRRNLVDMPPVGGAYAPGKLQACNRRADCLLRIGKRIDWTKVVGS